MPLQALKVLLLPLLAIVVINVIVGLLRTLPAVNQTNSTNEAWPQLELPADSVDVREQLLLGGQWGQREVLVNIAEQNKNSPAASNLTKDSAIREYVQQQLQGIVYRNGWYLLFAQNSEPLPLELQEGDTLPNSAWAIGRIFADRIELLNSKANNAPVIISLYPISDASTEL